MNRQKIFFSLLIGAGALVALYFSLIAITAVYDYAKLTKKAGAKVGKWEVLETRGKYPLTAHYTFEHQGKTYKGSTRLPKPWHLNEASAVSEVKKMANRDWDVWFDPSQPERSSLQRLFPLGLVFRTLFCYGIAAYFIIFFRKTIKRYF